MTRFDAFIAFHRANPFVFEQFARFAKQAKETGMERCGARLLGERIRWYLQVETRTDDYKINNNHWPYYARLLMLTRPEFDGFFERRDANFDVDDATLLNAHLEG